MRRRIHEDMCSCDIVGLQTGSDVRNFLHCCETMLTASTSITASCIVRYKGRTTRVRALPDLDRLRRAPRVRAVGRSRRRIPERLRRAPRASRRSSASTAQSPARTSSAASAPGSCCWSAIPDLRGKVNFLQFLVPSRSELGVYQTYTDEIFELVESINDHFGDVDWQPVQRLLREQLRPGHRRHVHCTMCCS